MSNLALYANAYVYIDSTLLSEEGSVSIDKKSGLNPVFTVVNGYSGMSQGAAYLEVTIEAAVPYAGYFNPDPYLQNAQVAESKVLMGTNAFNCKGFITEATYHHSVNESAKLSMKMMCRFAQFQSL